MTVAIRLATPEDAEQIQAIYAPFVQETPVSFEVEVPDVEEVARRISDTLTHLPWLVCADQERVFGFVYASTHRARIAYQWSVDVSVYIHEQHRRKGLARALYTSLFACLRLQGFYNAIAGITLPNAGSVGIHTAMGFEPVGVYRAVGYKLGAWHDVGWWQLMLQKYVSEPVPPEEFTRLVGRPEWPAALAAGLPLLSPSL
jgi:phosphinothricin acetyltransferase